MIRSIAFFVTVLLATGLAAQSAGREMNITEQYGAQNATGFARYYYDAGNIKNLEKQVTAWAEVVKEEKKNTAYWFNYYMISRQYYIQSNKGELNMAAKRKLATIATRMNTSTSANDSTGFEKLLVNYFTETDPAKALVYLKAAEKANAENTFILPELARYYDYLGNVPELKKVAGKMQLSTTALYQFSKMLINTLPDSCLLITNGDYDTYAAWLAAYENGKHITVLSLKLAENKLYKDKALQNAGIIVNQNTTAKKQLLGDIVLGSGKKVFVSLTISPEYLGDNAANLYNTGYCYLYSTQKIDNITLLNKNLIANKPVFQPSPGGEVFKNLVPGYITLYRYYKENNPEEAGKILAAAREFALAGGFWNVYEPYFK